jgi:hypothetical protein
VQLGQVGRVVRETPKALRDALQRGDLHAAVNLRIGFSNFAWLAADQTEVALEQVDDAMSQWSKQGFHLEHFYELFARTNALVYAGRSREARANLAARWRALWRSFLPSTIQSLRILAWHGRARCALAVAEGEQGDKGDRAALLREAADAGRRIERERMAWATPLSTLLSAGIALTGEGNQERAASLLRTAAAGFDAAGMALSAAAARRRLGGLLGGEEGRTLVEGADTWMKSESVKDPAKMTAMLAPGFAALADPTRSK